MTTVTTVEWLEGILFVKNGLKGPADCFQFREKFFTVKYFHLELQMNNRLHITLFMWEYLIENPNNQWLLIREHFGPVVSVS